VPQRWCRTGAWTSSPPTCSRGAFTRRCTSTRCGRRTTPGSSSSARARDFYGDWERAADDTVSILRTAAGRDPYDRDLSDLAGELSTRSDGFRSRWAAHNVRIHRTGTKDFHHPVVGDLSLTYEMLDLSADSGLAILAYTAEPGSKSAEALDLLASWTATLDEAEEAETSERAWARASPARSRFARRRAAPE